MEITQIDGQAPVLEETLETLHTGGDVVSAGDAVVDESGGTGSGTDVESSESVLVQSDNIILNNGSEVASEGSSSETLDAFVQGGGGNQQEVTEEEEELNVSRETLEQERETSSSPVVVFPEEPMAVYLVEQPEEEVSAETYSVSGGVYPGTISTTYLDYFSGIVDKLGYNEHYVAFRSSQYEYYLVWGEGLEYDLFQFKGSALDYCRIYRNIGSDGNYYVEFGNDTFYVSPGSGFVYSDLGNFASLTEGGTHLEFATILFAIGFTVVYNVCHDIFDYIMEHVYRK